MSLFKRILTGVNKKSPDPFTAPVAPDVAFYVIGDIHGREDLFSTLIGKMETEISPSNVPPVVLVGDYIDRGEQSANVLRWLHKLCLDESLQMVCLMGNHEDMMLKFLDDPVERGARWLRFGGLQTLASFGVGAITEGSSAQALMRARDELQEAVGEELIEWLRNLPTQWSSGNVTVVHAAADPHRSLETQNPRVLKWGHPDFFKVARADGNWIVHGHTIVDEPHVERGRIAIDTGAFATGRLTAAHIRPGSVRFLHS